VLRLTAQHLSQAEIARRYGVTIRTVRRWLEEARTRRLGTFRRATADGLLADTELLHDNLRAKLLQRMEAAEAAGNDRLWLECVKRIQAVERDRYVIREKVGFFDAYRLAPPLDPATEQAARLQRMTMRFMQHFRAQTQAPGEDPDADADDAAEEEALRREREH
jgi:transcriptional regulator with XRE-family HTH domain